MKKANIGWTLLGLAALVFFTPLGAIPLAISFYPAQFAQHRAGPAPRASHLPLSQRHWTLPREDGRPGSRLHRHGPDGLGIYAAVRRITAAAPTPRPSIASSSTTLRVGKTRSCRRGCGQRAGSIIKRALCTFREGTSSP